MQDGESEDEGVLLLETLDAKKETVLKTVVSAKSDHTGRGVDC
jgi:hypothetical protein